MAEKNLGRNFAELIASILAAVIVVKGIVATVPDAVLLNRYGEIYDIIQLALGVIAIGTFCATYRWLDGIDHGQ